MRMLSKPTVESAEISISRADDFFTVGDVMPDIWKRINAADFIIADLTGRNPNVFYELGIAHTIGKPVVLLSQSMDDVPFDVRHQRVIEYSTAFDRIEELKTALKGTIATLRAEFEASNELVMPMKRA